MTSGKKIKKTVYEKQVVFYSKKYADREKAESEKAVIKAMDLVSNPARYARATSHGVGDIPDCKRGYGDTSNFPAAEGSHKYSNLKAQNQLFKAVKGSFSLILLLKSGYNIIVRIYQYFLYIWFYFMILVNY